MKTKKHGPVSEWELEIAESRSAGLAAAARQLRQAEFVALDDAELPNLLDTTRARFMARYQALRDARIKAEADAAFAERDLAGLRERALGESAAQSS